ncbi:MAG TPA: c-type cytochrome, partial [Candidatus Limnocylindria bacterium]|nr:c-type cytochrome [Candidatus Limnocylindria bacterium]
MEATRTPRLRRALARTLVALLVVETGWLAYPTLRARLLALEETPARRGQRLAGELGCFSCHGPGGGGGTKNPGSEEGTVPAFTERTQMMYVKTTEDLREYVLDGAPRRKREDPDYRAKVEKAALRMPAFREHVNARQLD